MDTVKHIDIMNQLGQLTGLQRKALCEITEPIYGLKFPPTQYALKAEHTALSHAHTADFIHSQPSGSVQLNSQARRCV